MIKKYLKYIKHYLIIHNNNYFDVDYYREKNPDVKNSQINPIVHFIIRGWREGRNPSRFFDTKQYLEKNKDVNDAGINPLAHYILFGQYEGRIPYTTTSEITWQQARKKRPWHSSYQQYLQGLNVVGFLQTVKGLSEVIRNNRHAFDAVGIKYSLIDYEFTIPDHQKIIPIPDHKFINDFRFNTNIFHINPPQLPFAWETFPKEALTGRYSIGVWYWELPIFPDDWCFAFDLVDEIWVASDFILNSVRAKTDKPVIKIPPCIYVDEFTKLNRRDFNLPADSLLFMCAFDVLSSQQRKNPTAVIKAFKQAFPKNDPGVGLVIKVNNAKESPLKIFTLKQQIAGYKNIYFIDEIMDRAKLNALINIIDVYVSLHRSEGFGLVPAEAMILGKPVIMTNWSGNLELMRSDNSCGVEYELTKIKKNNGPYKKGQYWAEPDIDHAATFMRKIREDEAFYQLLSVNAEKFIKDKFSPNRVGTKILDRLRILGLHS